MSCKKCEEKICGHCKKIADENALITLLDSFAMQAVTGFLSGKCLGDNYFTDQCDYKNLVKQSYRLALAMIKERTNYVTTTKLIEDLCSTI